MTSHYEAFELPLPSEFVEASNGFSLDIGCSTAKLIYRCNVDYKNGKPQKDELKSGKGRVYIIPSIARTKLDDVIDLIRTRCDLIRTPGKKTEVFTTGAGCNLFQEKLEKELDVSLINLMEFECFVKAFYHLTKTKTAEELLYPESQKAKEDGKKLAAIIFGALEKMGDEVKLDGGLRSPDRKDSVDDSETLFPCIIGMCGSGVAFKKVEADGTWKFVDGTIIGGRMFLGLSALLTKEKDFTKIFESIKNGSCRGVDEYTEDLVSTGDTSGSDKYGAMKDFEEPGMPFGKAVTRERDEIPDDDILHSLYRVVCLHLLQIGMHCCNMQDAKNLYFCGNFINNEMARHFMTKELYSKKVILPKDKHVNLGFIQHGGHLGSLGAFMKAKETKDATMNTDAAK